MKRTTLVVKAQVKDNKLDKVGDKIFGEASNIIIPLAGLALPLLFSDAAQAVGGEYGILEGRILSLLHPILNAGLLLASFGAAYTGLQHRRSREIVGQIKDVKAQIPPKQEGDTSKHPLEEEVAKLEEDRKWLSGKRFRERHWNIGSVLLGGGVTLMVYGCLNTYLRTGKLFPGPHLYSGGAIVCLWAIAAALVPSMQRGNNGARTAHIGLNGLNILLFISQVPTGWPILEKVLQNTSFP